MNQSKQQLSIVRGLRLPEDEVIDIKCKPQVGAVMGRNAINFQENMWVPPFPKTNIYTNTNTKTKTKGSKDPSPAIFVKSWEFKDVRYDAYNDKDNDQEKDNDNDNDKDKDKDKDESAENLNICYIFEKLRIQGYQIW